MGRRPRRNVEDTSDTLNQMDLLMEGYSHVGLRECRELLAEAGKLEVSSLPAGSLHW